jgi:hypothetical protein
MTADLFGTRRTSSNVSPSLICKFSLIWWWACSVISLPVESAQPSILISIIVLGYVICKLNVWDFLHVISSSELYPNTNRLKYYHKCRL